MADLYKEALFEHRKYRGKIAVESKVPLQSNKDLSLFYSPGVAFPCKEIAADVNKIYDYTIKGNTVAVVSNGTAVLGLGNIGAHAALPVMEGKAVLFKKFAAIDAFPICLDTTSVKDIVVTLKMMTPVFGGINLEDIASPSCFYIEKALQQEVEIPVFHDDQHGTAIVTLAALINSLKLVKKHLENITVVINGAGAAGIAVAKLFYAKKVKEIIVCDSKGAIYKGRKVGMNDVKEELAKITNLKFKKGDLKDVIKGADVFIGVSKKDLLTEDMVKLMNKDAIIFAMANPMPEIMPQKAKRAGARVVGTGRSDYPNQVNNVLAFPGVFRGALDVRARVINEEMKIAAAYAISSLVDDFSLTEDYVIPSPLDKRVVATVAKAVAEAAKKTNVATLI